MKWWECGVVWSGRSGVGEECGRRLTWPGGVCLSVGAGRQRCMEGEVEEEGGGHGVKRRGRVKL